MDGARTNQPLAEYFPRSLSSLETWSFGLTGNVCWISTAPVIHAALDLAPSSSGCPGDSILLNLQVQRLGSRWPEMAGGTPGGAAAEELSCSGSMWRSHTSLDG